MDIDKSDAAPHQAVTFEEMKHLVVHRNLRFGKSAQKPEIHSSVVNRSAGEFTEHKRMHKNLFGFEQRADV